MKLTLATVALAILAGSVQAGDALEKRAKHFGRAHKHVCAHETETE
jgi:hypothetical protein